MPANGGGLVTAALLRSDATAIPLGDNTVDLIVTSPPYSDPGVYQVTIRKGGMGASLVRSDATAIPLGDSTVDLIVTSPP